MARVGEEGQKPWAAGGEGVEELLTIWSFTVFPSNSIVLILKSTPIVEM